MAAAELAQYLTRQTWARERQSVAGLQFDVMLRIVAQTVAQALAVVFLALERQWNARLGTVHHPARVRQAPHVADRVEKLLARGGRRALAFALTLVHRPRTSRYFSASSAAMHPLPALVTACR